MTEFKKQLFLKLGIGLGGVIVLVALTLLLSSDISRRVNQIQSQRSELFFRTQTIDVLATLKSDYEKVRPHLSFLENILPSKDQLITFSKDMETMARQNKVDLGFSFGPETPATDGDPGYLSFTITVAGTFNDLLAFVKDVGKSRYFTNFVSIDINRRDSVYTGNLSGRVFSQ